VTPAAGDGGATPVAAVVGVEEAVMDEDASEDPCAASIAEGELRAGAETGVDDEGEKPDEADRGDAEVEEAAAGTGRSTAEAARIKPVAAVLAGCSGTWAPADERAGCRGRKQLKSVEEGRAETG
jgi:hypothetical protein